MLTLHVTRTQFSDMLRFWDAGRLKELHFRLEKSGWFVASPQLGYGE
jgi:hypothetical protein